MKNLTQITSLVLCLNDCYKRYYFGEDMDNYDKDKEQLIRKYLREVFSNIRIILIDVSW